MGTAPPTLHSEYLQTVVVADGNPVGLSRRPLHVVDLSLGCVGQDRVLDGPRHLLDVPDEGLMVIRYGHREQASKVTTQAVRTMTPAPERGSQFTKHSFSKTPVREVLLQAPIL